MSTHKALDAKISKGAFAQKSICVQTAERQESAEIRCAMRAVLDREAGQPYSIRRYLHRTAPKEYVAAQQLGRALNWPASGPVYRLFWQLDTACRFRSADKQHRGRDLPVRFLKSMNLRSNPGDHFPDDGGGCDHHRGNDYEDDGESGRYRRTTKHDNEVEPGDRPADLPLRRANVAPQQVGRKRKQ
jgi:hypothetical protein